MASFRKRGDKWEFRIVYNDPNGKRKEKAKGGFKTKKEAQIRASEIEKELHDKTYIEPTDMTLGEFMKEWQTLYAEQNMRPTTLTNRLGYINKHILPIFGKKKIASIKAIDIQNHYNSLELSTASVKTIHNLFKSFFKHAVKWGYVKNNIMDNVTAKPVVHKKMKVWEIGEITQFLKHTADSPLRLVYILAIYCGMRRGEILGLRWDCVDFKDKRIRIEQALALNGNKIVIQAPKTAKSVRSVAISDEVLREIKKHKIRQPITTDLVFCTSAGTPYNPRNLLRDFYKIIELAGVGKIRFHDLRHTHATLLLRSGENIKVISERLGHTKSSFTMDTYSHVLPDMQQAAADKFEELLNS